MKQVFKMTASQAKPIVGLVFPDYKGRKFSIEFTDTVTFSDTNWSGGTKATYAAVKSDGQTGTFTAPAPWSNPVEGKTIALPVDTILVRHLIFCGKDLGVTIYANPVHVRRLTPVVHSLPSGDQFELQCTDANRKPRRRQSFCKTYPLYD